MLLVTLIHENRVRSAISNFRTILISKVRIRGGVAT